MNKDLLLSLYLVMAAVSTSAQTVFELPKEEKRINDLSARFFMSVCLGPVSPTEVNQFIEEYIDKKLGPTYINIGSSKITGVGMIEMGVDIPISIKVHTRLFLEYAGTSKTVQLDDDTERFVVNRFAPGVLFDYYFYTSGFSSFFLEGGVYLAFTTFRDAHANGAGIKFNMGYAWYRPQTIWEIFFGVDLPPTKVSESNLAVSRIDLTAPVFGLRLNF